MLETDPQEQFAELKTKLVQQIEQTFPLTDRTGRVEVRVKNLQVEDKLGTDDLKSQFDAKLSGKSWAVPVTGTIEIVENGKVLIRQPNATIARIPKMTRHFSYIVAGQEKHLLSQWRLRPGVYVRETQKPGEFKAQFQLAQGRPFSIQKDGASLYMSVGSRKVPLYAMLSAAGVSDAEMQKEWGEEIFAATKAKGKDIDKALRSLHTAWTKESAPTTMSAQELAAKILGSTKMDPAIAQANLGLEASQVNKEVLLRASKKLLYVSAGNTDPDPIDSIKYKELWTGTDHLTHRLEKARREIGTRVQSALSKPSLLEQLRAGNKSALRDVVMPDLIQRPLYHVFLTDLAVTGDQTNPLTMLSDRSMTTIRGKGGLTNASQIKKNNQVLDVTSLGFLDPVFTPEGDPGVTTHLTAGVRIKDKKPHIRLYNYKTGKIEEVDAARAASAMVVLPDQVRWSGGKPVPIKSNRVVRMHDHRGEMQDLPMDRADYVLLSPGQVFAIETNLVPFMQNDSAGRTTMSARHMAQAISLTGREPPLVQVEAGKQQSFEKVVGSTFLAVKAPVAGTVTRVTSNAIYVTDDQGKSRVVDLYHHYPTNHLKGQLHSTPLVKVGDKVKAGQLLADNNYTKNGTLALGTNIRVAYLANGDNHEDGIVISESAARKLESEHLYKPALMLTPGVEIGKRKFLSEKAGLYDATRLSNIGDDGLVKPGTTVKPGDPLVLALGAPREESVARVMERKLGKALQNSFTNASLTWSGKYPGEVIRVARSGNTVTVHVRTIEPAQVGSKLSTRHSAKGIVTSIKPDSEMPKTEDGKHTEMLINVVSVPGRMNPGQILETVAGNIAEKTGKPYVIKNFDGGVDYLQKMRTELKKHGIPESQVLVDPKTGRRLGEATVGPHYVFQLEHQIDKKTHYRAGGGRSFDVDAPVYTYDIDTRSPKGGGTHGAQRLGALGVYGMMAAGMHGTLREAQTVKSDMAQAHEAWGAIRSGDMLPPPQVPFAYQKFEALLQGLGVNLEKKGTQTRILPRSDAETRAMSGGVLTRASRGMRGTNDIAEKGGLFDPNITGMLGERWSHIELAEPMPNPVYAKAIALTFGLDTRQPTSSIGEVVAGTKKLPGGLYGGKGIREALKRIDLDKELAATKAALDDPKVTGADLNKLNFKFKALQAVKDSGKTLDEAWTIQAVPVLPPVYRPQTVMSDGSLKNSPLNQLYRRLAIVNESLSKNEKRVPYNRSVDIRMGLYQELQNLFGTTPKGKKALDLDFTGKGEKSESQLSGILHTIAGNSPKDGFFQNRLIQKRQDYTARATIVADPALSADEVAIPKKVALELYRPMVEARLIQLHRDPARAAQEVSKKDPAAIAALEEEIKHRPVVLKRDPVLHQYGLVGQHVRLTDEPAIKVSPLILPPIGGDIDGDTVSVFVPLSQQAVQEAKQILPSNRPISESSGDVMLTPTNESALALVRMSMPRRTLTTSYATKAEAEKAFLANKLNLDDAVTIGGVKTTLGRARIADVLPDAYKKTVLTDLNKPFSRKEQERILKEIAIKQPGAFLGVADGLTRVGFQMAYDSGHSITLKDLEPLRKQRDALIAKTQKEVDAMRAAGKPEEEITKKWLSATSALHDVYTKHYDTNRTNVSDMRSAGIKAKKEQFQGLVMAPMLIQDPYGRASKVPVTKSFSEGVDLGGYFMQAGGTRGGQIDKTQSVREPGYMSKLLVQANIGTTVTGDDCGTSNGVLLNVGERDVIDRFLAKPVTLDGRNYAAGAPVTPELLAAAKKQGTTSLLVRSPLKCREAQGVCAKCMGVHPTGQHYAKGEAVGVVAAQALGERAAQLMLKQTHGGGIMPTGGKITDQFGVVDSLFSAADRDSNDAPVAMTAGRVLKVTRWPDGTHAVYVEGRKAPYTSRRTPIVKPGQQVTRGQKLTEGEANIKDLLATRGLEAVQNDMVRRIGDIYAGEGVLRRHAEVAVRSSTSLVRIKDPGDYKDFIKGDYVMKPLVDALNEGALKGKRPIVATPTLKAVGQIPRFGEPDFIARLNGEDLARTLTGAIQHGARSDLRSLNPIPSFVHGQTYGTRP